MKTLTTPRCCILGATGFIGGQIVRAALARSWEVRGIRRRPRAVGALDDVRDQLEWMEADLDDPASLSAALRDCPLVFHAAAYYPTRNLSSREAVHHGVVQMRNLLAAAATVGTERIIYTSSPSTIGRPAEPDRLADEGDLYLPGTVGLPYFEVKWAMEQEALRASAQGLPVVVVIPSAVIGPGDIKPTTSSILVMVAHRFLRWYVAGELNIVDGRDLAMGHVLAAERGETGQRYIVGGHNLAIREILTTMAEVAEVPPPQRAIPVGLVEQIGRLGRWLGVPAAGQMQAIRHWQPLDSSRAHKDLGLPDPRPFRETCRDTLAWLRDRGYL